MCTHINIRQGFGCRLKAPQSVQGEALVRAQGAKPRNLTDFVVFMEAKVIILSLYFIGKKRSKYEQYSRTKAV